MNALETGLKCQNIEFTRSAEVRTPLLCCRAELVICPKPDQVPDLFNLLAEENTPHHVHGAGTNTLLMGSESAQLKTPIIDTRYMNQIRASGVSGFVTADAGAKMTVVSRTSAEAGLTGLEFARDIPGTVAGGVVTDAWHPIHTYAALFAALGISHEELPKHVSSVLRSVEVIEKDGSVTSLGVDELEMHDRQSIFSKPDTGLFILSTKFQLSRGDPVRIAQARDVICQGRKEMREKNKEKNRYSVGHTLGYTFVLNTPAYGGLSAAQIIAKTERLPDMLHIDGMVHSKQTPNIVGSTGRGTSHGYLRVAEEIHEAVLKEHNIDMPLEVRVVI